MEQKQVYMGILVIAILVCILSPFLASSTPDGLEASAEHINEELLDSEQVISPIMPDYTLEGLEDNPFVGVGCLIVGLIISVAVAYGIFKVISKNGN
ncbi:MAG: PDGLE domain-containing protein [Methanosphaera sp.]|nr:PDGLE domain-containing protein [Methanosphaera sp.]